MDITTASLLTEMGVTSAFLVENFLALGALTLLSAIASALILPKLSRLFADALGRLWPATA